MKDCNQMYKRSNDKYKRGKDIFIKAFQVFKVLMVNVDKPITPMELTDAVLHTQFHYKVNDYKTLGYNKRNCRLEEFVEKSQRSIFKYSLILKPLPLNINTCHIYVGFTMMIYNKSL